jgi:hypothetical protein
MITEIRDTIHTCSKKWFMQFETDKVTKTSHIVNMDPVDHLIFSPRPQLDSVNSVQLARYLHNNDSDKIKRIIKLLE